MIYGDKLGLGREVNELQLVREAQPLNDAFGCQVPEGQVSMDAALSQVVARRWYRALHP